MTKCQFVMAIMKFQLEMSICNGGNRRKLKITGIVLSPRVITLPKIN